VTAQDVAAARFGTAAAPIVGSCHGFQVRSPLPLRLVRDPLPGSSWEELTVDHAELETPEPPGVPVRRWLSGPRKPFSGRLHETAQGYCMWIDGLGAYSIDRRENAIRIPARIPTALAESRLWGIPSVLAFLRSGQLPLHAAAVVVDGQAVLLAAPGRHGKTTLAAAFHQAGFHLLSEDVSRVTADHPEPSVYPGAAMLRLRHDVQAVLGDLPGTEVVLEDADRVHLRLRGARRGGGVPVPVAAVVMLHVGEDSPRLEQIDAIEATRDLWALSFKLPSASDRQRTFLAAGSFAAAVPAWKLTRPLTIAALPEVIDRIVTTCVT
jgi:hypothetical protein